MNNVYNRNQRTKREEYEEKLKQRNENESWIFGNTFGRPGGGAPLRDKNGNVITNFRTISNGNIFKYDAQEFTKGENTVNNMNNNYNINRAINDPFIPFRQTINQFDNQNNNINNNMPITEEQKRDFNTNQYLQNPYLIQLPDGNYGILAPYPLVQPQIPNFNLTNNYPYQLNQNPNPIQNIINNQEISQQRPYSSLTANIPSNNNININTNNLNNTLPNNEINFNSTNNKSNANVNSTNINNVSFNNTSNDNIPRKFLKKIPESTLFNEAAQERKKLEHEMKNDRWKKELREQIEEKRKRDEEKRREQEEQEKKDILENDKFMKYKKKQREEHTKKIKEEQEKKRRERMQSNQSQSVGNILDLSNNIDQVNKSILSNNNITFRDGNINLNLNELSQNNINLNNIENEENIDNGNDLNNINENIENNNFNNNYNSLYNPIQENFKNEINRQYHLLNQTLNHDIDTEMKRISKDLENNYTPFTQKLLLMNTYSKSQAELSSEQNKKIKKIENMIEDKKLVDYILGKRARPPSPPEGEANIEIPIPSYFGINRDKAENKYLGLHSKSSFINKGDNISNYIASGRNQDISSLNASSLEHNYEQKNKINNMYNLAVNNNLDINYVNKHYNDINNRNNKINSTTIKSTFGTNIENDETLGGMVNTAQNLDNISVFIPLNKDQENLNLFNEKKMRRETMNENRIRDKDMESMFKDLDKIYELTNKIDVSSKAKDISSKFKNDLNKIQNKETDMNKYYKFYETNSNDESLGKKIKKKINDEIFNKDKITEENSKYTKSSNKEENEEENNNNMVNKIKNKIKITQSSNKEKSEESQKKSKESYVSSELKSENEYDKVDKGEKEVEHIFNNNENDNEKKHEPNLLDLHTATEENKQENENIENNENVEEAKNNKNEEEEDDEEEEQN